VKSVTAEVLFQPPTNSSPEQANAPIAPAFTVGEAMFYILVIGVGTVCVWLVHLYKQKFPAPQPLWCTNLVYSGNCYAPLNAKLQWVRNKNVLGKVYYVNPLNGYSIWVGPTANGGTAFSWVYTDKPFGGTTLFCETVPADTNIFFSTNGPSDPVGNYMYPAGLLGPYTYVTNFGYWGRQANLVPTGVPTGT
jgi:hypothetical protein